MENNELIHYGILGMKWGVRRYQKKDGTLTSAGKKRYGDADPQRMERVKNTIVGVGTVAGTVAGTTAAVRSLSGNRYQNKDGSLTEEGKKRHERDIRENLAKKKENRIDTSEADPKRYAREDLERTSEIVNASKSLVNEFKKIEQETTPKPTATRLDLSKMSDKELRDKINRELLEQQYNKLFAEAQPAQISKGRATVETILEAAGSALAITGSVLSIAVAIKKLSD